MDDFSGLFGSSWNADLVTPKDSKGFLSLNSKDTHSYMLIEWVTRS